MTRRLMHLRGPAFVASSGSALGYRPFVSTDASVADTGDVEIEFGYIGFRADHAGATVLAPEVMINLGVVQNIEGAVQSTLANDVTHQRGVPSVRRHRPQERPMPAHWPVRSGTFERPGHCTTSRSTSVYRTVSATPRQTGGGTAGLTFAFPWDLAEEKRP